MERLWRLTDKWTLRGCERRVTAVTRRLQRQPSRSLRDHMRRWAKRFGDRPALVDPGQEISFRDWNASANRYARWARSNGFAKGDVVAVLYPHGAELVSCWTGLARVGVVPALLDSELAPDNLAACLRRCGAKALLVHADLDEGLLRATCTEAAAIPVFCFGPLACTGASRMPRLDLWLRGFSSKDIAPREAPQLTGADGCLLLPARDMHEQARRLTHGDCLRMMLTAAAAMRLTGAIALSPLLTSVAQVKIVGAALASGRAAVFGDTDTAGTPCAALSHDDLRAVRREAAASGRFFRTLLVETTSVASLPDMPHVRRLFAISPTSERTLRLVPRCERNCADFGRPHLPADAPMLPT
jgi:hypothetical protein